MSTKAKSRIAGGMLSAIIISLPLLFPAVKAATLDEREDESEGSLVYVHTNQAPNNSVVVLHRSRDGALTRISEVFTGGQGSGPGPLPPAFGNGPGPNPLTSSNSILMSEDGKFLLAVNAGSDEISVFRVDESELRLVDKVPSGGQFPNSLTTFRNLVYVLNQRGATNITGFVLSPEGKLHQIPNSTQPAGASDSSTSEVIFAPDGHTLIVTETLGDLLHVYRVGEDGRAKDPVLIPSNSRTPSAAAFTHNQILAVTEAHELMTQTGAPHMSTMSTYHVTEDSKLELISGSVPNEETASCWIIFTKDGRFAYVSSMGSGTISSYAVSPEGKLTLLAASAASPGPFSVPVDLGITKDNQYLYVLAGLIGTVEGYHIEHDGSLTPVTSMSGFPVSMQGIVVR